MKLKKIKIRVEAFNKLNNQWSKALKGKGKSTLNEEVLSVPTMEILGKILSLPRIEILLTIPRVNPKSINALAKFLHRDFKNVYTDVQFLSSLGLIELEEGKSNRASKPIAKFESIEFALVA